MEKEPLSMEEILKQDFPQNSTADSNPVDAIDVELTQDEIDNALRSAKIKKADLMEYHRREAVRQNMENYFRSDWTIRQFVEFIKQRMISTGFIVDDANRNVVNALCYYFNGRLNDEGSRVGEKEFEKFKLNNLDQPMDRSKGLFLFGSVGVGKTRILELFKVNKLQCYQVMSCRKIVSEYVKGGSEVILPLSNQSYPFVKSIDNFWQEKMGVGFDDLGTESEMANNYGNKINVFEQIILDRYDNHVPPNQTHITSNLTPAMIRDRYGDRVSSRMREDYNLIEIVGKDRRK